MAVEMRHHSKRLYRHAAPLVVITGLLLGLSGAILGPILVRQHIGDSTQLVKALVTPVTRVQQTDHGVAHLSSQPSQSNTQTDQLGNTIDSSGRDAGRSLLIQSLPN